MHSTLQAGEQDAIRELGCRLADLGVVDLLACYGNEEVRINALHFDLPLLPEKIRTLVKLFILGEPVETETAEALLSREVATTLVHLGIMRDCNDRLDLGKLRMVYHFGVLVFCEQPDVSAHLYYGNDSLALGRLLLHTRGRTLDVCAGVGTQGLLCALTSDFVIAVEQQPEAALLFAVNAVLNNVDEKTELRFGDLVEPVFGETFDQVCCNPPLLPVPNDLAFPIVAHGGPDGLTIVKRLLAVLPELLREGGRCHTVGTLVGSKEGPDLRALQMLAVDGKLDILLVLPCRESLGATAPVLEALALTASRYGNIALHTARKAFLDHFTAMGVDHLYSFLMVATRARGCRKGEVRVTKHYLRGVTFWTV